MCLLSLQPLGLSGLIGQGLLAQMLATQLWGGVGDRVRPWRAWFLGLVIQVVAKKFAGARKGLLELFSFCLALACNQGLGA